MKQIALFSFLLILTSCMHREQRYRYEIENKTNQRIDISAFFDSKIVDGISIEANSIFVREKTHGRNSKTSPGLFNNPLTVGVDSISIILGREVYKTDYCEFGLGDPCEEFYNNILNNVEKNEEKSSKRKSVAKRIIFESSYFEDALPLPKLEGFEF